jgi:rfaE bifunctional protein kinase chain/domain
MNSDRFTAVTDRYPALRVAILGDFCLDRYLEIDPGRAETSIETGLPVHNVVQVRGQPGAAGTILNNLVALRVGTLFPLGFCGEDGEGYELQRALAGLPGVRLDHFVVTPDRRTFTYCKPLLIRPARPPEELNRLDTKNWTPTPAAVERQIIAGLQAVSAAVDAVIVLDQVGLANTGVVTANLLAAVEGLTRQRPDLRIVADSRRGLQGFPPVTFKMNAAELAALTGGNPSADLATIQQQAAALARKNGRDVFVTLAERGIVGASAEGTLAHVPALPVRGAIDIVGAGDAVTANLTAALAAGATGREAMELAMAAASLVIHQLGTTGTASVPAIRQLLGLT